MIRKKIPPTIKSIEGDIFKLNRDRIIIGMANYIASKMKFFIISNSPRILLKLKETIIVELGENAEFYATQFLSD